MVFFLLFVAACALFLVWLIGFMMGVAASEPPEKIRLLQEIEEHEEALLWAKTRLEDIQNGAL